uniref:Uncharacterized protein n=1 Tax=Rhizophora mucronata TaxID=61149 RepID=A0A2P2QKR7_RHIMU
MEIVLLFTHSYL